MWDEPEANLNPELYPLVAEILLELQENGVQIFLATHSYKISEWRCNYQKKTAKQIKNGTSLFSSGEYWKWKKIDRSGGCSFHR